MRPFRDTSEYRNVGLFEEVAVPSRKPAQSAPSTMLPFVVRTITPGASRRLRCPDCHSPLNLIQPDENEPARLLGTCDSCMKWSFLVELEPDWRKALLVELPGGDEILRGQAGLEPAPSGRSGV
jgi:hypothetical protein